MAFPFLFCYLYVLTQWANLVNYYPLFPFNSSKVTPHPNILANSWCIVIGPASCSFYVMSGFKQSSLVLNDRPSIEVAGLSQVVE